MKYRSRTEIFGEILTVARGTGVSRTKVMYKTILTFLQAREYLSILTERGLIQYDKATQTYRTTERGLKFLDKYTELSQLMKGLEEGRVTKLVSQEVS
jgi:predicted transcriptional regulator